MSKPLFPIVNVALPPNVEVSNVEKILTKTDSNDLFRFRRKVEKYYGGFLPCLQFQIL